MRWNLYRISIAVIIHSFDRTLHIAIAVIIHSFDRYPIDRYPLA